MPLTLHLSPVTQCQVSPCLGCCSSNVEFVKVLGGLPSRQLPQVLLRWCGRVSSDRPPAASGCRVLAQNPKAAGRGGVDIPLAWTPGVGSLDWDVWRSRQDTGLGLACSFLQSHGPFLSMVERHVLPPPGCQFVADTASSRVGEIKVEARGAKGRGGRVEFGLVLEGVGVRECSKARDSSWDVKDD